MPNRVVISSWAPKASTTLTSSDSAQSLPDSVKYFSGSPGSRKAQAVEIVVEDAPIRVAHGVNPTIAGLGKRVDIGGVIYLHGWPEVDTFRFINAISGSNATLQITAEF